MKHLRRLLRDWLLEMARRVDPSPNTAKCWQVIQVPRRISESEEQMLAEQVVNL